MFIQDTESWFFYISDRGATRTKENWKKTMFLPYRFWSRKFHANLKSFYFWKDIFNIFNQKIVTKLSEIRVCNPVRDPRSRQNSSWLPDPDHLQHYLLHCAWRPTWDHPLSAWGSWERDCWRWRRSCPAPALAERLLPLRPKKFTSFT